MLINNGITSIHHWNVSLDLCILYGFWKERSMIIFAAIAIVSWIHNINKQFTESKS